MSIARPRPLFMSRSSPPLPFRRRCAGYGGLASFHWTALEGACPSSDEARAFFENPGCVSSIESIDSEADFDGELCCYDVTTVDTGDEECTTVQGPMSGSAGGGRPHPQVAWRRSARPANAPAPRHLQQRKPVEKSWYPRECAVALVLAAVAVLGAVEVVAAAEGPARRARPLVQVAHHVVDAEAALAAAERARGRQRARELVQAGVVHVGPRERRLQGLAPLAEVAVERRDAAVVTRRRAPARVRKGNTVARLPLHAVTHSSSVQSRLPAFWQAASA